MIDVHASLQPVSRPLSTKPPTHRPSIFNLFPKTRLDPQPDPKPNASTSTAHHSSLFNSLSPTQPIPSLPLPSSQRASMKPPLQHRPSHRRGKPSSSSPRPVPPEHIAWYQTDTETREAYAKDPFLLGKIPFDLPPEPGKKGWNHRCFNCLVKGHPVSQCRAPVRACAKCLRPGHGHASCTASRIGAKKRKSHNDIMAALQPRGNLGDAGLPFGRIQIIDVYRPATADSIDDLRYLDKGIVIDGRLKPGSFQTTAIQAALLLYASFAAPFPMVHLSGDRFLLLLNAEVDRAMFLATVRSNLEAIGLVVYPWSPAIDASPVDYRYKVWIDLHDVPIQAWNKDHLFSLVGQFGLLLEHTPFFNTPSLEHLRILVAVRYLEDVPVSGRFFFGALKKPIPFFVLGWIEEPLTIRPPLDPTLSSEYFAAIESQIRAKPPPSHPPATKHPLANTVEVDFEAAFKAWVALLPSEQKDDLARYLQRSPFWSMAKYQEELRHRPQPQPPLPSIAATRPTTPLLSNTLGNFLPTMDPSPTPIATADPQTKQLSLAQRQRSAPSPIGVGHVSPPFARQDNEVPSVLSVGREMSPLNTCEGAVSVFVPSGRILNPPPTWISLPAPLTRLLTHPPLTRLLMPNPLALPTRNPSPLTRTTLPPLLTQTRLTTTQTLYPYFWALSL